MKKFLHSLLALFMGVTTAAIAGQSGPHTWDGSNETLTLKLDTAITFSYTAVEEGTLYIYSDNQGSEDNVPLTLEGGWYHDGAYDPDSPLLDVAPYGNGLGFYGQIKVLSGDEIRFTISTPKEAGGTMTRFTLKSAFFDQSVGGDSWEKTIKLTQDKETQLPVYPNNSASVLGDLWISNATYCRFTAPSDGVASIYTSEYLIYVLEEKNIGSLENPFRAVSQDASTNDHEFMVSGGVDYIVVVPNARPTTVTFKMTQEGLGHSAQFPIEITAYPTTINLVKGNNYYAFGHELIGNSNILEVTTAAGWNGTITYMENTIEASTQLAADKVTGRVATFVKDIDTRYLQGNKIIMNFEMTDKSSFASAATLNLREPEAGESFATAVTANLGENIFNNSHAGDYWFAYTAEKDAVYSFTTSGTLKHVNFTAGVELKVQDNVYRINAGETIYVCVTTATAGNNVFTITSKDIVAGDYCDNPIYFELGNKISIKGRGVDNFHAFTAEENGFAIFTSSGWTVHFREECGGRRLSPIQTVTEQGNDVIYTYKLPVAEGQSYIVEVEVVSEDITITTGFEAAEPGEVCAIAIAMEMEDTVKLEYEFEVEKWYKIVADEDGFYTVSAKLGYAANMITKVGDCDAKETNTPSDNSYTNAYMGGYKATRIYLEEGQTLYIYTKTGSSNDSEQFGDNFYLVASYAGAARPGEVAAVAIKAEANTEYTALQNDESGYEQWYTYTIPANEEVAIELSYTAKTNYLTNNISLYKEDMETSMSSWNGDFTQTNLINDAGATYGKRMEIPATDEARTIYIKVNTTNAKFYPEPVVWKIISGEEEEEDIIIPVDEITLNHQTLQLTIGQTTVLNATINPSNATNKTVTWSSSDTDVATVDLSGKVTAKAEGTATITAKAGDKEATCEVTVKTIPVSNITLNQTQATLVEGSSMTLKATVTPQNATNRTVTWSSSNTDVATVDQSGKVTAKAVGTAIITAKAGDKEATCEVTVEHKILVSSVTLDYETLALMVGQTSVLKATVNPSNATDKSVTWSSSNPTVATVDKSGRVTAKGEGTATITAKAGDKKATCEVTVEKRPDVVNGITLSQSFATLSVGKTLLLTATIDMDNNEETDKTVTWSSSNTAIATVDEEGLVTAIAEGKAIITAAIEGKEATCEVTVENILVNNITLNQTSATLVEESTLSLTATVEPIDAIDKTVTWSSSNTDVATVDENGVVTAVAEGTATITAKAGDVEATCTITVTRKVIPVDGITLNQDSNTIVVGNSLTLIATVTPEEATDKTVTWSSSDDFVATVDDNGKVTAMAVGTAYITATAGDKSAICTIVVIEQEDNEGVKLEKVDGKSPVIYDLMGRRVTNPTKGIYIINGVKHIIR